MNDITRQINTLNPGLEEGTVEKIKEKLVAGKRLFLASEVNSNSTYSAFSNFQSKLEVQTRLWEGVTWDPESPEGDNASQLALKAIADFSTFISESLLESCKNETNQTLKV